MKTASAAKIAAHFNEYLEASRDQAVLVTRNGKPVAVLLAVQDKAEAEQLAQSRPRSLRSVFEEAHKQLEKGGGIPHDQFWREVEQSRRAKRPAPLRGKKAGPSAGAGRV
jgi:prevent-host-death family protein